MFFDEEGPELKAEKAENDDGGGVDVGRAPLALLSCVMEDSKAGPGISGASTLAVFCRRHISVLLTGIVAESQGNASCLAETAAAF